METALDSFSVLNIWVIFPYSKAHHKCIWEFSRRDTEKFKRPGSTTFMEPSGPQHIHKQSFAVERGRYHGVDVRVGDWSKWRVVQNKACQTKNATKWGSTKWLLLRYSCDIDLMVCLASFFNWLSSIILYYYTLDLVGWHFYLHAIHWYFLERLRSLGEERRCLCHAWFSVAKSWLGISTDGAMLLSFLIRSNSRALIAAKMAWCGSILTIKWRVRIGTPLKYILLVSWCPGAERISAQDK